LIPVNLSSHALAAMTMGKMVLFSFSFNSSASSAINCYCYPISKAKGLFKIVNVTKDFCLLLDIVKNSLKLRHALMWQQGLSLMELDEICLF